MFVRTNFKWLSTWNSNCPRATKISFFCYLIIILHACIRRAYALVNRQRGYIIIILTILTAGVSKKTFPKFFFLTYSSICQRLAGVDYINWFAPYTELFEHYPQLLVSFFWSRSLALGPNDRRWVQNSLWNWCLVSLEEHSSNSQIKSG